MARLSLREVVRTVKTLSPAISDFVAAFKFARREGGKKSSSIRWTTMFSAESLKRISSSKQAENLSLAKLRLLPGAPSCGTQLSQLGG